MSGAQYGPTIPLVNAYLCVNCDCIGTSASACAACEGTKLMSLAGILNREEAERETEERRICEQGDLTVFEA